MNRHRQGKQGTRAQGFRLLVALVAAAMAWPQFAAAQTITTVATFNNIGIDVRLTVPASTGTLINLHICDTADPSGYRQVHPLSRLSATRYAGSAVQLDSGTTYSLKLVSSAFTTNQFVTVNTRANSFPNPTGIAYHVNPTTGLDSNSGLASNTAFRTLGRALVEAAAGVKILLHSGRYFEGDLTVPRSGTESQPFVIENAPGAVPVLDGTDTNFNPTWVLHDASNGVYRTPTTRTPENAYLDGMHLYHYRDINDLTTNRWMQPAAYHVDGTNLYVRIASTNSPAGHVLTIPAFTTGITIGSQSHVYIRGIEMCYYGYGTYHRAIHIDGGASNLVDRCFLHHNGIAVALKRAARFNTIQYCTVTESPVSTWSWHAVKEGGVGYEAGGVAVYASAQENVGNVVRYNLFTNMFDGSNIGSDDTNGPTSNFDFHGNVVSGCGDDAIETDGVGSNNRIYHNQFSHFLTGVSLAPCALGPTYVFRNVISEWHPVAGYEGYPFKFNVTSPLPIERVFLYHNTCFTSSPDQDGFLFKNYCNWTNIVSRNNIFVGTRYAIESWSAVNPVDFDYDNLYTTNATRFARWAGANLATLAAFTAATGQESHGLATESGFVNSTNGDFYLRSDSPLIDKAIVIPGFSDWHVGAGPDIGAYEFGMRATKIGMRGTTVSMEWTVTGNARYQLQATGSLAAPAWVEVTNPPPTEGARLRLDATNNSAVQRFFRLTRLPPP